MNKKKLLRNVSLVALSAVMVAGSAAALAGCGPTGVGPSQPYVITVNIFCDATDKATNDQICQNWAKEYTEKLRAAGTIGEDQKVEVKFSAMSDRDAYFTTLSTDFTRGRAADIIYVQPKTVKTWAKNNRIMNLAELINATEGTADYDKNVANIQGLWQDVLAFYGYSDAPSYSMGDSLAYYKTGETIASTGVTATHGGFYTNADATEVGVYGLPKDYSNFTMGFNGRYFSDALKYAYQTVLPGTTRSVSGASKNTLGTFTGAGDEAVVRYAVTGDYKIVNPLTGEEEILHAVKDEPAPLINIGVPVYYKPYNFYAFKNYNDALAGNDPIAKQANEFTDELGYLITLPGFPGDTFEVPDGTVKDANAPYDTNIGHVTLTYAEYGALTWAVTYFCNTFNFRAIQDATSFNPKAPGDLLTGTAGVILADTATPENVFGNDQYEGAPNATLYLLPWLAGNDANFINLASDTAINAVSTSARVNQVSNAQNSNVTKEEYSFESNGQKGSSFVRSENVGSKGGEISEKVPKLRLSGEYEQVDVQYGVNSKNFIETFGAFLAYGSDWNGNSGNARSEDKVKEDNGWSLFRKGACIFYGAGTWDNKTKNESPVFANGDGETITEWRIMTEPVGEKYALASWIKNSFYDMEGYGHADNDGYLDVNKPFTQEEIIANQMLRQDKWGARMDSVGFALNDSVRVQAEANPNAAWKIQGCADLIMTLSAQPNSQHDLTIGGAQLPNFRQQCEDLLNYQKPLNDPKAEGFVDGASDNQGAFADMITPEGFSTTNYWEVPGLKVNAAGKQEADQIWRAYLSVVEKLNNASDSKNSAERGKYFKDWFAENYPNGTIPGFKLADGSDVPLRWDEQYADSTLKDVLTGELARRAAAMKVLKMVTYTYADRDMQVRMQYGVNAVRDSAMYTYELDWINAISMRQTGALAYRIQAPITQTVRSYVLMDVALNNDNDQYVSPAYFCFNIAHRAQALLEQAMYNEATSLS